MYKHCSFVLFFLNMYVHTHTYTHLPAKVTLLQEAMASLETASEPTLSVWDIQGLPFHFPLPVLTPTTSPNQRKRGKLGTQTDVPSAKTQDACKQGEVTCHSKAFSSRERGSGVGHLLSFHRILPLLHEFWSVNNHFKTCGILSVVQEKTRRWFFKTIHVDGFHVKPLCWE